MGGLAAGPPHLSRTPDGHPDLQGIWNNATQTPLQRPVELGSKQFYTDEELVTLRLHDHDTDALANGDPGTYNQFWWEEGGFLKQTSLIVDPPNGRMPPLTPEGERRRAACAHEAKTAPTIRKSAIWRNAASRAARQSCRAATTTTSKSCRRQAT